MSTTTIQRDIAAKPPAPPHPEPPAPPHSEPIAPPHPEPPAPPHSERIAPPHTEPITSTHPEPIAPLHPERPDPDHLASDTPEPDADPTTRAIPEQAPPSDLKSRYAATRSDAGMSTAEYAVGTLAAVAFALLLIKVINSPEILDALTALVDRALNSAG